MLELKLSCCFFFFLRIHNTYIDGDSFNGKHLNWWMITRYVPVKLTASFVPTKGVINFVQRVFRFLIKRLFVELAFTLFEIGAFFYCPLISKMSKRNARYTSLMLS